MVLHSVNCYRHHPPSGSWHTKAFINPFAPSSIAPSQHRFVFWYKFRFLVCVMRKVINCPRSQSIVAFACTAELIRSRMMQRWKNMYLHTTWGGIFFWWNTRKNSTLSGIKLYISVLKILPRFCLKKEIKVNIFYIFLV